MIRLRAAASLRTRLVLLVVVALLPAIGLVLYTGFDRRADAERRATTDLARGAAGAAATSGQLVDGARQMLITLAALPEVRSFRSPACSTLLARLRDPSGAYANLGVAGNNGSIECSALPFTRPLSVSDRSWFRETVRTRKFSTGEYQIGRITKRATINLGYPLLLGDKLDGVIFAAFDLTWLEREMAGAALPKSSALLVVDRNGVVLTRRPNAAAWVGRKIPSDPLVRRMIGGGDGAARLKGPDGVARLYAFRALRSDGGTSAYLSLGIPAATVFADANRAFGRGLTLLVVVGALAVATAWLVGHQLVTRPIKSIVAAAKRVEAGDLTARAGIQKAGGEIALLAAAFDAMTASLQDWEARLVDAERKAVEERFRGLLDIAADAIISVDESGRIVLFNKGAEELFGYRADEILGSSLNDVMPARFANTYSQQIRGFAHAPAGVRPIIERREIEARRRDGTTFAAEATLSKSSSNGVATFTLILRDVSERRRAEQALRESERRYAEAYETERTAAEHLRALDRLKTEFVGMVAHDIRSPMAVISGFADLMDFQWTQLDDDRKREMLDVISRNARSVAAMVEDVLQVAKIETGEMHYDLVPLDLGEMVRHTVGELQSVEPTRRLELHVAPDLPPVLGDEGKLLRVQTNLLVNALKFSPPDRPVTVGVDRRGQYLAVSVRDEGIGIRPEDIDKLFQKFSRVEQPGDGPKAGGSGLGLFVCRSIVEDLGGAIRVESAPGKGSVFTYTVPVAEFQPVPGAS